VTIEEAGGDFCLDLAFLGLFAALFVASVIGAVRIDIGGKGQEAAIVRPDMVGGAGGDSGELASLAAANVDEIDLPLAVAVRLEGDGLAVGRPTRPLVPLAAAGELSWLASGLGLPLS